MMKKMQATPVKKKSKSIHEDIAHLLRRANQYSQVQSRKVLGPYKITPIQYAVLRGLDELGPTIQRRLALHVGLEPSNLHEMLKRLANRNFISISINTETERRDFLSLTKKASNLLNELNPLFVQHNKELMNLLSEEEKKPFVSGMKKIAAIR
jgi:MarR family transcriptional regulator, lower aerobic nicotinate degradation pathway regulator